MSSKEKGAERSGYGVAAMTVIGLTDRLELRVSISFEVTRNYR